MNLFPPSDPSSSPEPSDQEFVHAKDNLAAPHAASSQEGLPGRDQIEDLPARARGAIAISRKIEEIDPHGGGLEPSDLSRMITLRERMRDLLESPTHEFSVRGEFTEAHIRAQYSLHEPIYSLATSQDGRLIAAATRSGEVSVLELRPGASAEELTRVAAWRVPEKFPPDSIISLAFSPDSRYVVCGGHDRVVRVLSLSEVDDEQRPAVVAELPVGDSVTTISFSPNGDVLAVGSGPREKGAVRLLEFDPESTEPLIERAEFIVGGGRPAIAFTADGEEVFIGGAHLLRVSLDPSDDTPYRVLGRWDESVRSLATSPDMEHVVLGGAIGGGRSVRYTAINSDDAVCVEAHFRGYTGVRQVAVSPDGACIAVVMDSPVRAPFGKAYVLSPTETESTRHGEVMKVTAECTTTRPLYAGAFLGTGESLVLGGDNGVVWVFGATQT